MRAHHPSIPRNGIRSVVSRISGSPKNQTGRMRPTVVTGASFVDCLTESRQNLVEQRDKLAERVRAKPI